MEPITRLSGMTPTRSRAVRRGNLIYTVAVADTAEQDMGRQTTETLAKIERFLKDAGSDKSRLLSCTVYICDMALKPQMNEAWDAWVDMANPPQRACIGASLEHPHMVEIVCVAATTLPPASATVTCVVFFDSGRERPGPHFCARTSSICLRRSSA